MNLDDEGTVYEPGEDVAYRVCWYELLVTTNRLRGFDCPSAMEDGKASQNNALLIGKRIEAPVDRCPKRLLTRNCGASARREQPESIAHLHDDLIEREHLQTRCRQFDCEGDALELTTKFGDCSSISLMQRE